MQAAVDSVTIVTVPCVAAAMAPSVAAVDDCGYFYEGGVGGCGSRGRVSPATTRGGTMRGTMRRAMMAVSSSPRVSSCAVDVRRYASDAQRAHAHITPICASWHHHGVHKHKPAHAVPFGKHFQRQEVARAEITGIPCGTAKNNSSARHENCRFLRPKRENRPKRRPIAARAAQNPGFCSLQLHANKIKNGFCAK